MPTGSQHHSSTIVKLLLLGDAKCLAGDTIVKVTRGLSIGKAKTLEQLYHSPEHYRYDDSLDTYLLCDLGGYVGLNAMEQIVFSGVKETINVATKWGAIRATPEHKFLTDDGWKSASELTEGTILHHWVPGPGKDIYPKRAMVYSVPYHPNGSQHIIGDYGNYKRITKARAVLEAHMNGLSIEQFISILRTDPNTAIQLKYIPKDWDVHHHDRDRTNDELSNLEALPEPEHVTEHEDIRLITSKATSTTPITQITDGGKTSTYDVAMADPHNNFIANGFVVHNSGKTTALASLVAAGYKLRILDLDNLMDPLIGKVRATSPQNLDNIDFCTVRDKYIASPGGMKINGRPEAWIKSLNLMNRWKYTNDDGSVTDLGEPASWPDDCILVIDSLSRLCDSAYDFHESVIPKGKNGTEFDGRAIYGNAQDDVEKQIAGLTAKYFTCNVIVICHGVYLDMPDGTKKIFPQGVGQKLSPKIPQYFPNYVRLVNSTSGRKLQLISDIMISLATSRPDAMPKEGLDTETGLAKFFAILRNQATQESTPSPAASTMPMATTQLPRPTLLRRTP